MATWLLQLVPQYAVLACQCCWIWTLQLLCALLTVLRNQRIHLPAHVRKALAALWHGRPLCWCSAGCSSGTIRCQCWLEALPDALLLRSCQDGLPRYVGAATEGGPACTPAWLNSC